MSAALRKGVHSRVVTFSNQLPRACTSASCSLPLPTKLLVAVDAFGFADPEVANALQPMVQRLAEQLFGRLFYGFGVLIRQRLRQPVVHKEFFPEATTLAHGGKGLLHAGAELPGVMGNLTKMLGQQGLQLFPQQPRQHR